MERLSPSVTEAESSAVRETEREAPPLRSGIRSRWLLTCLLPASIVVAAASGVFCLYLRLTTGTLELNAVIFACAAAAAVILSLWLLCGVFIRSVTRSVSLLQYQARRIAEGSYGIVTEKFRDDELGDLTDSINEMSAELARSTAVQSEFISSVSHELRTPLTAIMGWAEAMGYDEAIQGESRRGLSIIAKEAGRLTKMVSELLEFTRIQDGRFTLSVESMDLAAEVEDAVFTYRNLSEQEGVELRYSCDEESIPMIEGDPERLKQVLLNVLDNAVKYGGEGKSIEVSLTAEEPEVVIRVRDHGPGIPPDELPHVKERFYKGSSKQRGSGIGLAVCEEIVARHGGGLRIENAEGGGVLVTVRLPVRQSIEKEKNNDKKQRK
ncbi:MAG: HAMP domain-containing histidine kinase [Oscillospiraceae bacterium]|nr:HAMP domain-containing histidine kinase [Oscillospiraceae bacterium]